MLVDVIADNPYGTNCWLFAADGRDCVLVDPGFEPEAALEMVERAGRRLAGVIATHGHGDHIGVAAAVAGTTVPVYVHRDDVLAFSDQKAWGAGIADPRIVEPPADLRPVEDGDALEFDGFTLRVLHTPGHTPGSACFLTDALVASGDLVFADSIGRFDFPNSDAGDMAASLERFFRLLPDELPVHPGHGPTTTVGSERRMLDAWLAHIRVAARG